MVLERSDGDGLATAGGLVMYVNNTAETIQSHFNAILAINHRQHVNKNTNKAMTISQTLFSSVP